jgi:beta-glucosidase/6-phospho-beta-glucosidase/beta-galactosidase
MSFFETPEPSSNKNNSFLPTLQNLKKTIPKIFTFLIRQPRSATGSKGRIAWSEETRRIMKLMPESGIFLTGIENADPVVNNVRRNQLKQAYDFEVNYQDRLKRIRELGITWLRFGPPYSEAHPKPDQFEFTLTDKVVDLCNDLGITIIADLLHFGLPEWLHEDNPEQPFFQNTKFAEEFAKYVEVFTRRYPSIKYFTLLNEPFVTATISAKVGVWNESHNTEWHDDRAFVRAVSNISRAAILARKSIEKVWQEQGRGGSPLFVQNESFEVAYANPGSHREAEAIQFNIRRFSALDLIFGHRDESMKKYLLGQGLTENEYEWFMTHGKSTSTILGIDHYPWCVYKMDEEGVVVDPLKNYQLYDLVKVYWERYKLPLLHTEINALPELAVAMCQKTYDALLELNREGYPIIGMGWYGDEYQVGWQNLLQGEDEYPVGLHYRGDPQPVALLFQELNQKGMPIKVEELK